MIPNRRMKSRLWKLEKKMSEKKRPKKEEKRNRQSRMTLLIFLSLLQIENYVMTAFSFQPIRRKRTAKKVFPTRGSCWKFQHPCVNGLSLLLFWYKMWTRLKKWQTYLTDFDLKVTWFRNISTKVTRNWCRFLSPDGSLNSSFLQPL